MQNPVPSLSSSALPSAVCSEDERSETERSTADGKAGANAPAIIHPDPEVVAKTKRRKFTAAYKQQILVKWRSERNSSIRQGLEPRKRGPKSKRNPFAEENQKLQHANDRLTEQLRKAELIIDVQKKVGTLLGWPLPDPERER